MSIKLSVPSDFIVLKQFLIFEIKPNEKLTGETVKTNVLISLLYLPTQICFSIGGERGTCNGSKLSYSLRQTKFTNSLG